MRRDLYTPYRGQASPVRSKKLVPQPETLVNRARQFTDLPIAVGFGISTAEQITEVWQYADAAVVGSAIVAEIELAEDPGVAVKAVEDFIAKLLPSFAKGDTKI